LEYDDSALEEVEHAACIAARSSTTCQ